MPCYFKQYKFFVKNFIIKITLGDYWIKNSKYTDFNEI